MKEFKITELKRLSDYAWWYYGAYLPSYNKLREKLEEKCDDTEKVVQILQEVSKIIDDTKNLKNIIRYYKGRHKNVAYIKQKLIVKRFKKEDIVRILDQEITSKGESILDKDYITKKIFDLKQKGKSENAIRQKLIERKEDTLLVESCLQEAFWDNDSKEALEKTLRKILKWKELKNLSREEKGKIIQKLLLRGFEYSEVKNYFASDE
jgi:SOS response regulatory protein OraA/RecX